MLCQTFCSHYTPRESNDHAKTCFAELPSGVRVVTEIGALCEEPRPDLVVECAGQGSVAQFGRDVLQRGLDFAVISTGAFADAELHQVVKNIPIVCRWSSSLVNMLIHVELTLCWSRTRQDLVSVAKASGARILLPSGAIAGMDGLAALSVGGLDWCA